jgi:hypothetical protein
MEAAQIKLLIAVPILNVELTDTQVHHSAKTTMFIEITEHTLVTTQGQ